MHDSSKAPYITGIRILYSAFCLQVVLRSLFEKLGATYIKLGQFIASSPTLFPEEYVLEFQKCLDKTAPVPWENIKATLDAEFGGQTDQVFSSVSQIPLATASIAQVHKAGGKRRVQPPQSVVISTHSVVISTQTVHFASQLFANPVTRNQWQDAT